MTGRGTQGTIAGRSRGVARSDASGEPPCGEATSWRAGKITPGCVTATRGNFATRLVIYYAMASMTALKVALGRIAFDVLAGSGS